MQENLYNPAQHRGILYNALTYSKQKKRKRQMPFEEMGKSQTQYLFKFPFSLPLFQIENVLSLFVDFDDEMLSEDDKEEIIDYFKHCLLPEDRKQVEKKMKDTKHWRRGLILHNPSKYMEFWHFLTLDATLVSLFFIYSCFSILICCLLFPIVICILSAKNQFEFEQRVWRLSAKLFINKWDTWNE